MNRDNDPIVGGAPEPVARDQGEAPMRPVIDGPPPSNWRPLLDAVRAGVARVRRGLATKPARRPAKALPAGATQPSEEALEAERTWIGVPSPSATAPGDCSSPSSCSWF